VESFESFSDQRHGWLLEKIRAILPEQFLNATEPIFLPAIHGGHLVLVSWSP